MKIFSVAIFGIAAFISTCAVPRSAHAEGLRPVIPGAPYTTTVLVPFADSSVAFSPDQNTKDLLGNARNAALIYIRGRTSTTKASARDDKLAALRALSARAYLIKQGVTPLKININFASATDFIADNSTAEGRAKNQRVEIEMVFIPSTY